MLRAVPVRLLTAALVALGSVALAATPTPALAPVPAPAFIDPMLQTTLADATALQPVEAVVTLDHLAAPTATSLAALEAAGMQTGTFSHLPVVAVRGTRAAFAALREVPAVDGIWFNAPVDETLDQATAQIQARDVWAEARPAGEAAGYTGRNVGVATIDSGIDGLHPGVAFPAITVQNVKPIGFKDVGMGTAIWSAAVEDMPVTDVTSGHGSHVAGIIAGRPTGAGHYAGVAPGAHLVGLGASDGLEMITILQSYDWILANRDRYAIRVINNSWAHSNPQVPYLSGNPLDVASKAAVDAGLVVVFAAGNAGQTGDVFNNYARNDWVVSVGAVDKRGKLAAFSSRGNGTHHADVTAPGHFIASVRATAGPISQANATPFDLTDPASPRIVPADQWPYYTVKSGTSMAAPHVSGLVALMLEANPALAPAQVRSLIVSTASPVAGCPVTDCGAGTVNALRAVRAALGLRNEPPVAGLTATPTAGAAPLVVALDASSSSDRDGTIAEFRWDWNSDATIDATTTTPGTSHTFAAGAHRVSVTVLDDDGVASPPATIDVRASDPPVAFASAPAKGKSGAPITFDASGSTDPNGDIVAYEWNFGDGSMVVTTTAPTITRAYTVGRPTVFGWSVRVVDAAGAGDATGGSVRITPDG